MNEKWWDWVLKFCRTWWKAVQFEFQQRIWLCLFECICLCFVIVIFLFSQVSHHPMIVACHCEGTGWKFYGDSNLKSKFWGRSIQLDPVGILTLEFDDGEVFQWSKVYLTTSSTMWRMASKKMLCPNLVLNWYRSFLSGYHINIQSHIGKAVLWSLWYNANTGKSRLLM